MAITNRERVGSAMDALKGGLAPFVSREFVNHHRGRSAQALQQILGSRSRTGRSTCSALTPRRS